MNHVFVDAYAKINLTLDVLGERPDGYHELSTIMQAVSLRDVLSLRINSSGAVTVLSNLPFLPRDGRNIAVKAANAFFSATGIKNEGLSIVIEKRIPVAAGLAGGSANAAAVLRALNKLFDTRLSVDELCKIGVSVGADVPFCIFGGTALARGIGERLTRLAPLPDCHIVIVKPPLSLSTPRVFSAFRAEKATHHVDTQAAIDALESGNLNAMARRMYNILEPVVAREHREITIIRRTLNENGAIASLMSGSGSATFGIFTNARSARACIGKLKSNFSSCFLAHPVGAESAEV